MTIYLIMENLKDILNDFEKKNPNAVKRRINQGDLIEKSLGLSYEIDDLEIYKQLQGFKEGSVPYGPVHYALKSDANAIRNLFEKEGYTKKDKKVLKFSKVVKAGLGQCLEKAILSHLATQNQRDSFFINGALSLGEEFAENHSYNVVYFNEKPHLIDIENPLRVDENKKITHPYAAPIDGINVKLNRFLVPLDWQQGRFYELD